jgi:acetyl esterase/lipase
MAAALLVLGIVGVLVAAAVVLRGRNIGALVVPYFLIGWLTGELAPHIVALQAVAALALVAAGALAEPSGQVGLGLLVLTWFGLAIAQFRAVQAEPVLRRALREGLARADESPGELGKVRSYVPYRELVNPFSMRRPEVEVVKDIPYGDAGHRHCLDLYRPRQRPGRQAEPLPVLLQIHGGGWTIGDKREQAKPLMYLLAANGWGCVAANYRLSPGASFPDHICDVKRAVAWIRRRGREYGLDPSFVAVTGGSAGGHLAALAALTANEPQFQPGFEEVDTALAACVAFYGIYDFLDRDGAFARQSMEGFLQRYVMKVSRQESPEAWEKASPISHVRADAPPFFVIHGTHDSLALVENARSFVAALRRVSRQPVLYAELPGAQHSFEVFQSLRTGHTVNAVHRFLENVYAQARARRSADEEWGVWREQTASADIRS